MDFSVVNIDVTVMYVVVLSAATFLGATWCISKVVGIIKK